MNTPELPTPKQSMGITKMSPMQLEGHNIGIGFADEAFLHDVGQVGMTSEKLHENYWRNYTLGRNAVEGALGSPKPYAQDEIEQSRKTE